MNEKRFIKIAWLTLLLVYLVICAGGIVRMSGAGMGCPDWPTCFGTWIPPTNASQLPENYREEFAKKRVEKIEKFSNLLEGIGFKTDAETLRNNQSVKEKEDQFNVTKTWTEYGNRLVGFLSGNFMLLQFIFSLFLFRKRKKCVL